MINIKFKQINDYIIRVNEKILGTKNDIYYISNSVLTRNPFTTKILSEEKDIPNVTRKFILFSIIKYYLKAFVFFLIYVLKKIIYLIKRKQKDIDNTILIDTYFIVNKILENKIYKDSYFLNIENVLEKDNYTYLVKNFYGSSLDLKKFYNLITILNKSDKNIICEFDFITFSDLFKILFFIIMYPFKILEIKDILFNKSKVFEYSLIDSLYGNDFKSYIRYIVGKKLNINYKFHKIISWCEYQDIDKSFYKGLHESDSEAKIYGCQFLVSYDSWLNFIVPKSEVQFNLAPDILLTNGKYYLDNIKVEHKLGVSLRYNHIFNSNNEEDENKLNSILVLGSFLKDETITLLKMVKTIDIKQKVIIRLHPTHNFSMYKKYLDEKWHLSGKESLQDVMNESFCIITNGATGTSLEAVCNGKSTIIIGNTDKYNSIPLVDEGKGEIWDIAFSKDEIKVLYNKLIDYRKNNINEIRNISDWYRDNFFIEPTEENIIKVLELDKGNK